jgi:hypothetical protein
MAQIVSQKLSHPEYIRLPKSGEREPHTGLSRSTLDRLIRAQECNNFRPPVESKTVRIRGGRDAMRGVRLIRLSALLAHLNSQPSVLQLAPTEEPKP